MADSSTTSRRVGFALIASLATVVVLARVVQGQRENNGGLDKGIQALETAVHAGRDDRPEALAKAEQAFGASTGAIVVEPMAILGLQLIEDMDKSFGKPPPPRPDLATLTELEAAHYAQAWLSRGKPEEALAFLTEPEVRRRVGRSLQVVERFAEQWLRVREKGQK